MNYLSKIKNVFTARNIGEKAKQDESNGAGFIGDQMGYMRIDPNIKQAALKNWSGIAIARIGANVGATRYFFKRGENEVQTEFTDLLKKPNNSYIVSSLFYLISTSLKLTGNCFVWFPKRLGANIITQAWVLPTDKVSFTIGSNGYKGFQLTTSGGIKYIPPEEICHIKTMGLSIKADTLRDFYLGTANELETIVDAIFTDEQKMAFAKRFYARDGVPPLYVQAAQNMGKTQVEDLKQNIASKLSKNYIVAAILDANKSILPLADANTALTAGIDAAVRTEVCSGFGIPESFLTGNHQNRATAQIVQETVYYAAIEPQVKLICEYLTMYFRSQGLPDDIELGYDDKKFYDESIYNQVVEFGVTNGFIGEDEYRELMSLPKRKVNNGDTTQQEPSVVEQGITDGNQ